MPRASELRTNFTAGELSPLVDARTQFNRYFNGSAILENFVALPQGPAFRRKGFKFVAETKDATETSRLIPFEFSTTQTYSIELGEGYLRFFSAQGRVLEDATTITGATQANPVVITDTGHPYLDGDLIVIKDVVGMTELNDKEYIVANKTANTYELTGIDGTAFTAYASGGTAAEVHEITNPYTEAELFDVKFIQDSDVMYMAHPNHAVQKLIRVASNSFTLNDVDFLKGPFVDVNTVTANVVTITAGSWAKGDSGTLTASGGHTPFTSDHVGGLWKVVDGSDIAFLKITGFTSSTVVSVTFQGSIPASLRAVARFTWHEGEFSDARSHPTGITFHEQRMVLGGTLDAPQKVFFSQSNSDYENFEAGTEDDDAFNIKIAAQKGDPIRWLFSDDVLFVGTSNGVFRINSSTNGSVITVSDIDVKRQISYGSSSIQPELVGSSIIYMQKGDNKARGIGFSVKSDKYSASDLSVDSDHIIGSGIVEIDYQQDPLSSLWAVRSDGEIARLTSEEEQEVLAWSRFTTQGNFESISVVNSVSDNDEIYAIIKRTINGVEKRFVEVQEPNYLVDNLNRTFVDSFLTYNGTGTVNLTLDTSDGIFAMVTESGEMILTEDGESLVTEEFATNLEADSSYFLASDVGKEIHELSGGTGRALITAFVDDQNVTVDILESFSTTALLSGNWAIAIKTVTGLDHLVGATASICSDGSTVPDQVVASGGTVTLGGAGSIIHVGLSYTSTQTSMPIEVTALEGVIGTTQHKTSRIPRINIRFSDTNAGKIISGSNTISIPARSTNNNMYQTPPLFSGDVEVTIGGTPGTITQLSVIQDGPQPMTLKSINYNVEVNDK